MKNVLVTGGAGFIGSNFIRLLLKSKSIATIINLDKLTYAGSLENLKELSDLNRHIFIKGDICNTTLVSDLLHSYGIDTIVHFAAESHVDRSISGPSAFIETNIAGTFSLLEAARLYQKKNSIYRFHHISTDEVYGSLALHAPAFHEATAYAPNSPYSASKASSDHLVRAYYHTYGLPISMTHCSNNYGPYQNIEKFIPTVIRACLRQKSIPVYGDGSNIRDWLYVDDHCRGIIKVIQNGKMGETYHIGGKNEWSNFDLVEKICGLMDQKYPSHAPHNRLLQFVPDRLGHDWRYAINISKIKNELGWIPEESFDAGLLKAIDFYAS